MTPLPSLTQGHADGRVSQAASTHPPAEPGDPATSRQPVACPACAGETGTGASPATGRCAETCGCAGSIVGRELAGPVAELRGYLEALAAVSGEDDGPAGMLLASALAAAERVHETTTALITHTDANQLSSAGNVDLGEVVAAALDGLRDLIDQGGAHVTVGPLPTVPVDRALLYHVFSMLLRNALTHSGAQAMPRVAVTSEPAGDAWALRVANDGEGVPTHLQQGMFDLFDHDPDRQPGQGLGLATARRIVERHGGRIWMEDNPGGGTAVCFTLPSRAR